MLRSYPYPDLYSSLSFLRHEFKWHTDPKLLEPPPHTHPVGERLCCSQQQPPHLLCEAAA